GLSGGLVLLGDGRCLAQLRLSDIAGDGWHVGIPALLTDYVTEWTETHGPYVAYIERLGLRPGEGGKSSQTSGIGWGMIVGVLGACRIRVRDVAPQAWRRAAGLPRRSGPDAQADAKRDCVEWASQVPGLLLIYPRCRKPDQGVADAACIAYAGTQLEARP
ncbi:MAG: hypothetical protein ACO3GM_05540, partial [Candidatus Limnocylindrus sp.]